MILLHAAGGLEFFNQRLGQSKPSLWVEQGWPQKYDLPNPPGGAHGWSEVKGVHLTLASVLDFTQAAWLAAETYLAQIKSADLDSTLMDGDPAVLADAVVVLLNHILFHAGEIAALRGIQGEKGLPF